MKRTLYALQGLDNLLWAVGLFMPGFFNVYGSVV